MESIWVQLLVEFVGAFLGFLFAVLLAGLSDRQGQRKKLRLILESLTEELQDIVAPLKKYIEKDTPLYTRIAIPTWEALQHSGMMLELIEKEYFSGLVNAYALIKAFNEDRLYNKETGVRRLEEIVSACETALSQIEAERRK